MADENKSGGMNINFGGNVGEANVAAGDGDVIGGDKVAGPKITAGDGAIISTGDNATNTATNTFGGPTGDQITVEKFFALLREAIPEGDDGLPPETALPADLGERVRNELGGVIAEADEITKAFGLSPPSGEDFEKFGGDIDEESLVGEMQKDADKPIEEQDKGRLSVMYTKAKQFAPAIAKVALACGEAGLKSLVKMSPPVAIGLAAVTSIKAIVESSEGEHREDVVSDHVFQEEQRGNPWGD